MPRSRAALALASAAFLLSLGRGLSVARLAAAQQGHGQLSLGAGQWQEVPVTVHPLEFVAEHSEEPGRHVRVAGGAWITGGAGWSGALSGLAVASSTGDSASLLAVSDVGTWVRLDVDFGSETIAVNRVQEAPLLDTSARRMDELGYGNIFEGLALQGDDLLVATEPSNVHEYDYGEGTDRHTSGLLRYSLSGVLGGADATAAAARGAHPLGVCQGGVGPPARQGLEAVAHLGHSGRLLAVCETGGMAWVVSGNLTSAEELRFDIPEGFRVSSASAAPASDGDGDSWDVLVLLSQWQGEISGYGGTLRLERRRLSRLHGSFRGGATADALQWQFVLNSPPVLAELRSEDGYPVDNFEGMALLRTDGGRELIFVVSDDNRDQSKCQRTVLLMLEVGAAARGRAAASGVSAMGSGPVPYCGPQTNATFAAAAQGFWTPPPSAGRLIGAAVFTRHGDRTPLAELQGHGGAGPTWVWGSSCSRYFDSGSPLRSLRQCARSWTPPEAPFRLDYRQGVGTRVYDDSGSDLLAAMHGPSVLEHEGQLTMLGSHQLREVGRLYGRRYAALGPGLLASMVARSTPFNRTVLSAGGFIAGLREGAPSKVPVDLPVLVDPRLSATFAPPEDALKAHSYPEPDASQQLSTAAARLAAVLGVSEDIFDKASDPLHDCLEISACWGKTWAWPRRLQGGSFREELLEYKKLKWRQNCEARPNSTASTLCQVTTRSVLSEAFADMESGRFGYFSGHDSTLLPLFTALGLPSSHPFPPLAGHLALELYEDEGGQRRAAVLLNGRLQRPDRCAADLCTMTELRGGFVPEAAAHSAAARRQSVWALPLLFGAVVGSAHA